METMNRKAGPPDAGTGLTHQRCGYLLACPCWTAGVAATVHWEVVEAAHEYERWAEGPQTDDHAPFCDYRARKPAIRRDCDCGAFRQWTAEANDAADHLARLVLAAPTAQAPREETPEA